MLSLTAPPELCTALTNLPNAAVAFGFVLARRKDHRIDGLYGRLWDGLMLSVGLSSLIGFAAHLIRWPLRVQQWVWAFLAPLLCATASFFVLCALCERQEEHRVHAVFRILCYACAAVSVCIVAEIIWWGDKFLPVIIVYGGVCLVWGTVLYLRCAHGSTACRYYLAGLAAQIVGGAVLAASRLTFTLGCTFDHNSIYHVATLFSLLLFWRGYCLRERASGKII